MKRQREEFEEGLGDFDPAQEMCKIWNLDKVVVLIHRIHRALKRKRLDGSTHVNFVESDWGPIARKVNKIPCVDCAVLDRKGKSRKDQHLCEDITPAQVQNKYYSLRRKPDNDLITINTNEKYMKERKYWSTILQYTMPKSGQTTANSFPKSGQMFQSKFKKCKLGESFVPEPSLAPDLETLTNFFSNLGNLGVSNEIVSKTRQMVAQDWDKRFVMLFLAQNDSQRRVYLQEKLSEYIGEHVSVM